jgi:predicted DNA-binding transcriptional regulator YafY
MPIRKTAAKSTAKRSKLAASKGPSSRSAKEAARRYLQMALHLLDDPHVSSAELYRKMLQEGDGEPRSKRTFERDRRFVQEHFLSEVKSALEEARMPPEEALAHQLLRRNLDLLLPPSSRIELGPKLEASERVLRRQGDYREGRWQERVAVLSPDALQQPPELDEAVWRSVSDALLTGRQLSLAYRGGSKPGKTRVLNPLGLVMRFPVLYLVACTSDTSKVGWYALHRMSSVEVLQDISTEPKGFSLQRFIDTDPGLGANQGDIDLVLNVDEAIVHHLIERPFPGQRLQPPDEDGWCRLEVRIGMTDRLIEWIRSWGPAVHVEAPASLQAYIVECLQTTRDWYD